MRGIKDNLKPIIINSKEILDNYKENKLPVELLNSTYSFSPWFIVGFTEAEGNFDIVLNANPPPNIYLVSIT